MNTRIRACSCTKVKIITKQNTIEKRTKHTDTLVVRLDVALAARFHNLGFIAHMLLRFGAVDNPYGSEAKHVNCLV